MVKLRKGIKFMATGNEYFADEIGTLKLINKFQNK
jgi:hypothetical protein